VTRRLAAGTIALVLALAAEPVGATRPLDTDDTETQDPGTASLELGADYQKTGGAHTALFTGLVAVGLAPGFEVDIDLQWADGGAYALLGPSGCGKTTLLNIVSGLLRPTAGRILFGDVDMTGSPPENRNIAQVFQFPVVYDTMTVYDNLAFPLRNRGVRESQAKARVQEIAALLDLEAMLPLRASGLTADGKQKISLGRGLVRSDVNVIMLDEPLTVIDPHLKWRLRSKLKELHQRIGITMIYVTHDQTEAMTFADQVVVMHEGTVVQAGTPVELFERPRHTFVGHFIGSPGMNILACALENGVARFAGQPIRTATSVTRAPDGARTEIGVRPEFPCGWSGSATRGDTRSSKPGTTRR
jgi:glycerol transport system ATP-binding protein